MRMCFAVVIVAVVGAGAAAVAVVVANCGYRRCVCLFVRCYFGVGANCCLLLTLLSCIAR